MKVVYHYETTNVSKFFVSQQRPRALAVKLYLKFAALGLAL